MEAIGSLIYLMITTRPDIGHAVGMASRFMSDPRAEHWKFTKRIIAYLKTTPNHGIVYGVPTHPENVHIKPLGYSDSDFAADIEDRKSTSGYAFLLNGGATSWISKKQQTVAKSTTESEYYGLGSAASEAMWYRNIFSEIGLPFKEPSVIYGDNQSSISNANNTGCHSRSKHIDIQHHFIKELVELKKVRISYVKTTEQVADILTKGLPKPSHRKFTEMMGIQEIETTKKLKT